MDQFTAHFTEVYSQKLYLHKEIDENNIRLGFTTFKKLCIFDINDISVHEDTTPTAYTILRYLNFPCTLFSDNHLRVHAYSNDIIIYPYAINKTNEELVNEPIFDLKKFNQKFLNDTYKKASVVLKVEKCESHYCMVFYINNTIVKNVERNKQNSKSQYLVYLATREKRDELLIDATSHLHLLTLPSTDFDKDALLECNEKGGLKQTVKMFQYQIADTQWMEKIEHDVDQNTNQIKYKYDLACKVFNDSFYLYRNTLYNDLNDALQNDVSFQYYGGNLISEVGLGKCMAKDTEILMHNGSVKMVQDIVVGDVLMGDNSSPRSVSSLATGVDDMFDIVFENNQKYTVNKEHILCLKSKLPKTITIDIQNSSIIIEWLSKENGIVKQKVYTYFEETFDDIQKEAQSFFGAIENESVYEMSVKQYLLLPRVFKDNLQGYRVPVNFPDISISEITCAVLQNIIETGCIPTIYKCNSTKKRLQVLSGILQIVGEYRGSGVYEARLNMPITKDLLFLCRSLGISCRIMSDTFFIDFKDNYDMSYDIEIQPIGKGTYYGFTLDGNHRYLLGDLSVTHNTMTCLYTIFKTAHAQRNLYDQYVSFSKNCNYFYKRGTKKGRVCRKSTDNQDDLYCSEHKNSIFYDKRHIEYCNLQSFDIQQFTCLKSGLLLTNSTLVLCPNQLCDQWVKEYYDKFINDKRVILIATLDQYNNVTLGDILFSDVVIVSYQFLLNPTYIERNKAKFLSFQSLSQLRTTLKMYKWNRVILDEAHEIQNMPRALQLKQIILDIESNYKWNVSGTPFANKINSYIQLLSYNTNVPWREDSNINNFDLSQLMSMGLSSNIIEKTRGLFRRNTKDSVRKEYGGNMIKENLHLLEFTTQERNIYDSYLDGFHSKYSNFLIQLCCDPELFTATKDMIKNCKTLDEIQNAILKHNQELLMKNKQKLVDIQHSINIIALSNTSISNNSDIAHQLIALRRQQTIIKNTVESIERTYNFLKSAIDSLPNNNDTCPICLDDILESKLAITQCGHKFCWDCIVKTQKSNRSVLFKCPSCNTKISSKDVFIYKDKYDGLITDLERLIQQVRSTKIGNIIYFLKEYLKTGEKVILFSQWDEILHKVGKFLQDYNINIVYCNGSVYHRKQAIENFKQNQSIQVIMLSSRNCASGINLTNASSIILLEPVYGSRGYRKNIEEQSIGRSDRIGQNKEINIFRFIIKDTIEEDIFNNNYDDTQLKQLSNN